jgi:DNA (cytosine-5)-methyltransferase 1
MNLEGQIQFKKYRKHEKKSNIKMFDNSKNIPMLEFIDEPFESVLRVGTDCSGIEAPIQALRQLKIPFKHIFSSEIDKYCIQSIKANYHPEIIFGDKEGQFPEGDITKRNIEDVPDIDLYVAGFPCQPFSMIGKRRGFNDKRGNVFWSCLEVIEKKQPKYFILENVKGLLSHDKENKKKKGFGRTWNTIWESLVELEKYGYTVKWKVLNTKNYGIPHNRDRVFMVGSKNKQFEWPEKVEMDKLENYVDWDDKPKREVAKFCREQVSKLHDYIFVDIAQINRLHKDKKTVSCLVTSNRLWNVPLGRYMKYQEGLLLQGFDFFNKNVSNVQMMKQIGNSMSVNVIKHILTCIL